MEDMKYVTEKDISLIDILNCITAAGYKVGHDNHSIMGNVLHVYYDVQDAEKTTELYCRWAIEEDGIQSLEAEQVSKFISQNSKFKVLFNIQYRVFGIEMLSKILKVVLDCYDGSVYCDGFFFDKDTITKILNSDL